MASKILIYLKAGYLKYQVMAKLLNQVISIGFQVISNYLLEPSPTWDRTVASCHMMRWDKKGPTYKRVNLSTNYRALAKKFRNFFFNQKELSLLIVRFDSCFSSLWRILKDLDVYLLT